MGKWIYKLIFFILSPCFGYLAALLHYVHLDISTKSTDKKHSKLLSSTSIFYQSSVIFCNSVVFLLFSQQQLNFPPQTHHRHEQYQHLTTKIASQSICELVPRCCGKRKCEIRAYPREDNDNDFCHRILSSLVLPPASNKWVESKRTNGARRDSKREGRTQTR